MPTLSPHREPRAWLVPALLFLVVLVGAGLRAGRLGGSFHGDEMFHVAAAQSLNAGQGARTAPESPYTRALPFTWMVAASMRLFGDTEAAARLPSLLASLACILLVHVLGRRWFGPAAGLFAAGYLALEPLSVHYGSFARFYAPVQAAVLVTALSLDAALTAGNRALGGAAGSGRRRELTRAAAWCAVAALALGVGLSLQVLTAGVLAGFVGFALLRVARALAPGGAGLRTCRAECLVLAASAAGLLGLLLVPGAAARMWRLATHTEPWNQRPGLAPLYYAYQLRETYPLAWLLLPVGGLTALVRQRRRGLLLLCLFLVPLGLHSLLLRPKALHYLFPVMPLFFLLAAVALAELGSRVNQLMAGLLPRRVRWVALALLVLFMVRSSAWSGMTWRGEGPGGKVDWRAAAAAVTPLIQPGDLVVAGVDDDVLAARHYLPRVDAQMATDGWLAQSLPPDWEDRPHPPGAGIFHIPCWTDSDQVQEALAGRRQGWVVVRSRFFRDGLPLGRTLLELQEEAVDRFEVDAVTILRLLPEVPAALPPSP